MAALKIYLLYSISYPQPSERNASKFSIMSIISMTTSSNLKGFQDVSGGFHKTSGSFRRFQEVSGDFCIVLERFVFGEAQKQGFSGNCRNIKVKFSMILVGFRFRKVSDEQALQCDSVNFRGIPGGPRGALDRCHDGSRSFGLLYWVQGVSEEFRRSLQGFEEGLRNRFQSLSSV